jgi:hypothetical protein
MTGGSIPAILEGRKTQTRRLLTRTACTVNGHRWSKDDWAQLKLNKAHRRGSVGSVADTPRVLLVPTAGCHHKVRAVLEPADELWVRETHAVVPATAYRLSTEEDGSAVPHRISPDGTDWAVYKAGWTRVAPRPWKSPRFMPKWAHRIRLEVTEVRFERLQTITAADVVAEGVQYPVNAERQPLVEITGRYPPYGYFPDVHTVPGGSWTEEHYLRAYFASGWDARNAKRSSWEQNDWVIVTTFKRLETP